MEQSMFDIGSRIGMWTIIGGITSDARARKYTTVRCDCGTEKKVSLSSLRCGDSTNCGCVRRAKTISRNTTHGLRHARLWNIWSLMIQRCHNPNHHRFPLYGARGIEVCREWREGFAAFHGSMGDPPSDKHEIDRIDNNGNYEPGNCRWATHKENCRNRRGQRWITHNGETKTLAEWAESRGMKYMTLFQRIIRGWTPADAIETPVA